MSNQELLERIASYLPYRLKCLWVNNKSESVIRTYKLQDWSYLCKRNAKPILRPLSDLTKPCLEGGKVPIVELGRIVELLEPVSYSETTDFKGVTRGGCVKDRFDNQWLMFDFKEGFSMWHKPHGCPDHVLTLLDHQLQLFQQLYKWHFDIHGLIGKGCAIDVNTLPNDSNT